MALLVRQHESPADSEVLAVSEGEAVTRARPHPWWPAGTQLNGFVVGAYKFTRAGIDESARHYYEVACATCGHKRDYLADSVRKHERAIHSMRCHPCATAKVKGSRKFPTTRVSSKTCEVCCGLLHRDCARCGRVGIPEVIPRDTGWERNSEMVGGTWR